MKHRLPTCLVLLWVCAQAHAGEDPSLDAASQELDRELMHETHLAPATLELRFDGVETPRYELVSASFHLDDKPISSPLTPGPVPRKSLILFFGIVEPGPHTFTADLVFRLSHGASLFSYVEGYRFRVPGKVTLNAQRGLVLSLHTRVDVNDGASELSRQLEFVASAEPKVEPNAPEDAAPPAVAAPAPDPQPTHAVASLQAPQGPPANAPDAPAAPPAPAPTPGPAVTAGGGLAHEAVKAPRKRKRPKKAKTAVAAAAPAAPASEVPDVSPKALRALLRRARKHASAGEP